MTKNEAIDLLINVAYKFMRDINPVDWVDVREAIVILEKLSAEMKE